LLISLDFLFGTFRREETQLLDFSRAGGATAQAVNKVIHTFSMAQPNSCGINDLSGFSRMLLKQNA